MLSTLTRSLCKSSQIVQNHYAHEMLFTFVNSMKNHANNQSQIFANTVDPRYLDFGYLE